MTELTTNATLEFARAGDGLHAHVEGERSLEATIAYWTRIVEEVQARPPRWLLVLDDLRGHELSAEEWRQLVTEMKGKGLERVRIAHVKPHGLDHIEYCEIFAHEAGFDARAFSDQRVAERWLRYGTEEDERMAWRGS